MKTFFILTLLLFLPATVQAEDYVPVTSVRAQITGKDLMNMCAGKYDIDYGYCAGYLAAISEIMLTHPVYGKQACNHGPVGAQQLMELYRQNMEENPAAQMQPASAATAQTLARFFQCR
jgi:hypothetical protein